MLNEKSREHGNSPKEIEEDDESHRETTETAHFRDRDQLE